MSREKVPPRVVSQQGTVAAWFAIAQPTVSSWLKKGAPVLSDGSYDLLELARWEAIRRNKGVSGDTEESKEDAERRKTIALANKAELDVAARRAELVPIEQHRSERLAIIDSFCSSLEQLPSKLAPLLAGASTYEEIIAQLHAYARSMRVQLAAKHSPAVREQVAPDEPSGAPGASGDEYGGE